MALVASRRGADGNIFSHHFLSENENSCYIFRYGL
jgi:hypothetical protein